MDNAATSWPKTKKALEYTERFLSQTCSNVNRTYGEAAEKSEDMLLSLRLELCSIFHHPDPSTVILNSGITESINTVVSGFFTPGDHVITTSVEHNAVLRSLRHNHIPYSMLGTDNDGRTDYSTFPSVLRKETKALLVTAGSNVTGFLEDLEELSRLAHDSGLYFMVDTAQVSPFHEIDMKRLGIDALFFSGHKGFLGPEGTGGMILTKEVATGCRALIAGGTGSYSDVLEQPEILPDKFEAGTRNLPGLAGLYGSILEIKDNFYLLQTRLSSNVQTMREELGKIEGVTLYGPSDGEPSSSVISITIGDRDPARIAEALLDRWGIEVRVGLHCASTAHMTMGTYPGGTIRLSPGPFTTEEEISTTIDAIRTLASE